MGIGFFDPNLDGNAFNLAPVPAGYVQAVNGYMVVWSVQSVFSSDGDFSLAKQVLEENPHFSDPEWKHVRITGVYRGDVATDSSGNPC
jgi:hypothetical protein